jgi:hypothetical protein
MTENRTSVLLQTASQVLVVGAGLVYLFGFIIVSVFDASYGIADFSLFRARLISVGTIFTLLAALAIFLTFGVFSLFGFRMRSEEGSEVTITPQNRRFVLAKAALSIPILCLSLTLPLSFLFSTVPGWKPSTYFLALLLVLISAAVTAAIEVVWRKRFDSHPLPFVFLSAVITLASLLVLFKYAQWGVFVLVLWLSFVCLNALEVSLHVQKVGGIGNMNWQRLLVVILPCVFGAYAIYVYPNIAHQFGGGAPVPIVLHLTKKLPVFDSESVSVSLLDETEQGYYVLRGSDKAVFVTRGLVEEVEFLRTVPAKP